MQNNRGRYPAPVYLYLFCFKILAKIIRFFVKVLRFIHALVQGFWLDVLSKKSLYALTRHYYERGDKNQYKSASWNKKGYLPWEEYVIHRYFKDCKKIMVLGAGGGREVLALLKAGCLVHGYESNPNLVKCANELIEKQWYTTRIQYLAEDMPPQSRGKYNGIILGWGVYSHIKGRETRIRLIKRLSDNMYNNSPLLISFWAISSYPGDFKFKKRVANFFTTIKRSDKVELGDELSVHFSRIFTKKDIESELAEAGLKMTHYDDREYGNAVAHKIAEVPLDRQ
jgi:hypothetical protein